MHTVIISL